jgi:hypothetical protein
VNETETANGSLDRLLPAQKLDREPIGDQRCHRFVDFTSPAVILNEEGRITGDHQLTASIDDSSVGGVSRA